MRGRRGFYELEIGEDPKSKTLAFPLNLFPRQIFERTVKDFVKVQRLNKFKSAASGVEILVLFVMDGAHFE